MKMFRDGNDRIGIMGGTFNPIHIGHLILAENAYEQFNLDRVLIMPSGKPPHKENLESASTEHRVKMAELAIGSNNHFELSLIEVESSGYTYTYETLAKLKEKNPDTEYYFIMGEDSLFDFEKWKEPAKICDKTILVVACRDVYTQADLDEQIGYIRKKYGCRIYKLDTPNIDISSSVIRKRVSKKQTIKYYVPEDVERYIYNRKLYQNV
ncbi:nicotinate-nucleotide adenylyltransferase [Anaerobium acetethylicum]|uniref:Probable nicotinate-nucleotide adenylyltransferase n=1 Tax=Anaerobium acetethylicum TaxID=1619234 RepID=A0A1D3TNR3_9FIRM|nr:nicotinate-nucleotide adenylyltransferase [Anaerobium acetethylicum]SCP94992.1 nicotinate-nucleotide adenylyltransferase [Anaerobium acetethylicum]